MESSATDSMTGWRLVDEPVAEPDDGFDLPAGDTKLVAKASDVHVNRPCFDKAVVSPDPLEQLVSGNDAVLFLKEVAEQFEFAPGQPAGCTVTRHRNRLEVGGQSIALVGGRGTIFDSGGP